MSRPHWAARVDDALAATVVRLLRRRGWSPRVEPFTGYGSTGWVRVLGRVLLAAPGTTTAQVDASDAARAVRGWRSFASAQVPFAEVEVEVQGVRHLVRADRGGYVDEVLPADLPVGWSQVDLAVAGRRASAPVLVVGPEPRVALLSDVDDTVVVTALPRPLIAAWNAFVLHEHARSQVPGMAELYRRFHAAHPGAPTFYLSTGAWNVAPALRRFMARHGFPNGPLLLTDWGPTNSGWFRSGTDHKRSSLRRLVAELPQLRWVLVGDDGQHDPQLYAEVAREHPGQVAAVAIRRLTPTEQVLAHGLPAPTAPEPNARPVLHGADGFELTLRLQDAGLLGREPVPGC